jgi:cobalt/nickel transport system permease protein
VTAAHLSIDPRVKLILMVAFITALSLWRMLSPLRFGCTVLVLAGISIALGLRLRSILLRSLLLLPLVGFFALILALSGDPGRAVTVLLKTYLSCFSVLIVAMSTPTPDLMAAARTLHVPPFLADVIHLIVRYLFVLRHEARSTQVAIAARAGRHGARAFVASSGSVAILFVRALEKANHIFAAMISRGYSGSLRQRQAPRLRSRDALTLGAGLAALLATLFV